MLLITTTTLLRDPPRALSTEQGDPRWHIHASEIGKRLTLLFDGQPLTSGDVCTYDIDAGLIIKACRNGEGNLYLDHTGQQFAMKPLVGKVEVRWQSDAIEQLVRVDDPETPAGCRTDVAAIV